MFNRHLLMGFLMMPAAADPTFTMNSNASVRRQKDYLELAFKPADASTPVFVRVPMVSELGGYQPQNNTSRKPLYVDEAGRLRTLVSIINEGGNMQFSTAANSKDATFKKLLKAANNSEPVLYKAHYASVGITYQGEAVLEDRGIQGSGTDIPDWGFTVNAMTADILDADGNAIT